MTESVESITANVLVMMHRCYHQTRSHFKIQKAYPFNISILKI